MESEKTFLGLLKVGSCQKVMFSWEHFDFEGLIKYKNEKTELALIGMALALFSAHDDTFDITSLIWIWTASLSNKKMRL